MSNQDRGRGPSRQQSSNFRFSDRPRGVKAYDRPKVAVPGTQFTESGRPVLLQGAVRQNLGSLLAEARRAAAQGTTRRSPKP